MAPQPRPGIMDIAPYVGGEARIPGIAKPIRLAGKGYETKNDARALPSFPVSQMLTDFF